MYRPLIKRIVHPFSVFAPDHKTAVTKYLHVVGKGRLCDVELLQDPAGAQLLAGQHINDHKPIRIREGFEQSGILKIFVAQLRSSHIDMYLCV